MDSDPKPGALHPETGEDYVLAPEASSCWITVGNISVYVKRNQDGVSVELFPLGLEDWHPRSEASMTFAEASVAINQLEED
jgi:hypothetical protein